MIIRTGELSSFLFLNRVFLRDVMAALLVFLNNGTAAVIMFLTNPPGIELCYHANVSLRLLIIMSETSSQVTDIIRLKSDKTHIRKTH